MLNEVEEGLNSIQLSGEDSSSAESQLDKCLVNILTVKCNTCIVYVLSVLVNIHL